jgi:signal transduction histidine kinase
MPLRTHDQWEIEVEFVSNVYDVGDTQVIQCNILDVTDRKRAEDAIRVAHDQLEVRVKERTAELAHTNGVFNKEIVRRQEAESDRRDLQQQLMTVQEAGRQRIARELHEQPGQYLAALGLGLKVVKDVFPNPSPERDRVQTLQSMTDKMGREIHNLALELRPTALDGLGVAAALTNYTEGWSERSGVETISTPPGWTPTGSRARSRRPAVMMLDIAMPHMNGFEFAASLHELPGATRLWSSPLERLPK